MKKVIFLSVYLFFSLTTFASISNSQTGENIQKQKKQKVLMTEARLAKPPAEKLLKYVHIPRLEGEKKLFFEYNQVDLAHTVMLVEEGILSEENGAKILKVLKDVEQLGPEGFPIDPSVGSLLLQVEAYLFDKIGEEIGGRMHTGRSRIDQGATVGRLRSRNEVLNVMELIISLQRTLLNLAQEHVNTVTIFQTHLQHAQPSTFGHYLLNFLYGFERDFNRLKNAFERTNLNALGTAASVGTSWHLNRERTTEFLGFDRLVVNARGSYRTYDYAAEIIAMLSITLSDLYDLATDLYLGSTYEFRIVESGDEYSGSSSIMPQKKNPYSLEKVRVLAGRSIGFLPSALGQIRGAGTADAARGVYMMDEAFELSKSALDLMQGIMETLIVHKERMEELAGAHWSTSSNLADVIVRETGLSFRQAHHVVGRLVKRAIEQKIKPADTTSAMVDKAAEETIGRSLGLREETIRSALDPAEFVRSRVTTGSCNPDEVRRMIEEVTGKLAEEEEWLANQRSKIKEAGETLDKAIEAIIGG